MIVDLLENADQYLTLNAGFKTALTFLRRTDIKDLAPGRHEVDDKRVFAIIENAPGCKKEDAELEAHELYIDIQLVLDGTDNMGWKLKSNCLQIARTYNADMDIQFYADEPDVFMPVHAGMFAMFFPNDAHMPRISSGNLHKVIAKVKVDQR
jgi:biofilm protein TabA